MFVLLLGIVFLFPNWAKAQEVEKSYSNHDFFLGCEHTTRTFYFYFKLELNPGDQTFLYCSMYDGGANRYHKDMYDWGHWAKKGDTILLFIEHAGKLQDNRCLDTAGFIMKGNELKAIKDVHPWACMRFREDLKETKAYFSKLDKIDRKTWKHMNKRIRRFKRKMRKKAEEIYKKAFG